MEKIQIKVLEERKENFKKQVSKIKKMYNVQGSPFNIKELHSVIEPVTYTKVVDSRKTEITSNFKFTFFEIEYIPVVANNQYMIVGNLIKNKEKTLITYLNDDYKNKINPELYKGKLICDHCNTNRNRKSVLIVYDNVDKRFIRLGKACLQAYIPKSVDSVMNLIEYSNVFFSEGWSGGDYTNITPYFYFKYFVNCIYKEILENGYNKTSFDNETNEKSTLEMSKSRYYSKEEVDDICDDFFRYLKWEQKQPNTFLSMILLNNLRVFYQEDAVIETYAKQLIYVVLRYYNHVMKSENKTITSPTNKYEERLLQLSEKSNYLGIVEDRLTSVVSLNTTYSGVGEFGDFYIHTFVDENDNVLIYKGNMYLEKILTIKEEDIVALVYDKYPDIEDEDFSRIYNKTLEKYCKENKFEIKYKVKGHNLNKYNGLETKQTVISFVKGKIIE